MQKEAHILIVEDETISRMLLTALLENRFTVHAANNGRQALDAAHELQPDVILMDVMMPGMSGLEVCGKLAKSPRTAAIPVILVTGKTQDIDVAEGLAAGAIDYIKKPYSEIEVLARIEAALRIRKHARDAEAQGNCLRHCRDQVKNNTLPALAEISSTCQQLLAAGENLPADVRAAIQEIRTRAEKSHDLLAGIASPR